MPKGAEIEFTHPFSRGAFTHANFDFVDFSLWWQSVLQRIAYEAQAKQEAADAAEALAKKEIADVERQKKAAAAERARLRLGCAGIYRRTADKKVSDVTVREEQQVRACQALGLYPPH